MDWWKTWYLLTSTKTQIYAFIVHAHFSLAEQSPDARTEKNGPCPTLLGVLLWVISLFSQGVWSPEGELWRTYAWAVKQDRSVQESTFTVNSSLKTGSQQKGRILSESLKQEPKELDTWKAYLQLPDFFFVPKFWLLGSSGTSLITLSVDFILKVYVGTTHNIFQIYKTMGMPEPVQKFPLYIPVSGRLCVRASPPQNHHIWSLQRLVLLCITSSAYHFHAYSHPCDNMFNTIKGTRH